MSFVSANGHGLVVFASNACLFQFFFFVCFSRLPDYLLWAHDERLDNWDLLSLYEALNIN